MLSLLRSLALPACAVSSLLVLAPAVSAQSTATWVGSPTLSGSGPRLHVAATDGTVRLAYLDVAGDLHCARLNRQAWAWSDELVARSPVGGFSLTVDSQNVPYIAFNRSPGFGTWRELDLAVRTPFGWSVETVDPAPKYGYDTSITVDSKGTVHILAKQEQDLNLWYWTGVQGGPWNGEVVDSDSNPGRYSQLLLDSQNVPHAVYSTWSPLSDPRHAYRTGAGTWVVETLDSATDTYRGIGADIDSQDHVHVAYHDGDTKLFYTENATGSWSAPLLLFSGGGKYTGLACDRFDQLHVATNSSPLSEVYYLKRDTNGAWSSPELVASGSTNSDGIDTDFAGVPWIAVDHDGSVAVYFRSDSGNYCTSKPTSLTGCVPSLTLTGTPSYSAASGFLVQAGPVPGGNFGLFVYTTKGASANPITGPFGSLCIQSGPGMLRVGTQLSPGSPAQCNGLFAMDFCEYMQMGTQDPNLAIGARVDIQAWYRDPANIGGANLSEAGYFLVLP